MLKNSIERQVRTTAIQRRRAAALAMAGLGALGSIAGYAGAQTSVWNNTTGTWSDATRWTPGVPVSGPSTVLQFGPGSASYVSTYDLASPFQLNAIQVTGAAGRNNAITAPSLANTLDFVANGGTQPSISLSGGGTFRIANNVRVGTDANLSLNVQAGNALIFATAATPGGAGHSIAPVASPASVTIDGGGTVVWRSFTAQNVFVNNGTLLTDADGDFLGADTNLNIGASGIVDTGGFAEGYGALSSTSATALLRGRVNVGMPTGNYAYAGRITDRPAGIAVAGFGTVGGAAGTGSVAKNGGHTFTLSGNNTYGGATEINAGVLVYGADPVSATTNGAGFATGAITSSPFGRGALTLAGGTLRPDANRTIVNAMTIAANTTSQIEVGAGSELTSTGTITYTGTVNKVGDGLWRISAANGTFNAASVLNINAGEVLLRDDSGSANNSGDLNAAAVNVNNGATFSFGPSGGGGNPDLPNGTYINANAGGTVIFNVGEDFGGVNLNGGALRMAGNVNLAGVTPVEFRSGTVSFDAGTPQIGGAGVINKTTDGTVFVNGIPLNNAGGLNIQQGTLETNTSIGAAGGLSFGTETTAGTLRYTGFGGSLDKAVALNAGGGTIDVADASAILAATGVASGPGGLTKAGPGTLVLSANNTHAGTTTVNGGSLQLGDGGITGAIAGNVVTGAGGTLTFNRGNDVTFAGSVSGAGGVTKQGANVVNLTGALAYAGATRVQAGTLRVTPFSTGAVDVAGGATLAIANGPSAATLTATSLNLAGTGGGGATLQLELNAPGNPAVPLINVTGENGLTLNGGGHTLRVANAGAFAVGSFTLIDYAGSPITDGFALAPLPARTQGALAYDTANTQVKLNVTGVDSIKWNGNLSPDWDAGTAVDVGGSFNWRLASSNAATNFVPNDVVLFDDNASGTTDVNLPADVAPAGVTVDNVAKPYTFAGSGAITGGASLTKRGTGTLTVLTNNTNAGGTTVSGGTLQVGNGGTTGAIGGGNLTNDGAVIWNRSDDVTFAGNVAGGGTLTKQGSNTLTLAGTYTPTGDTAIAGGTLALTPTTPYAYAGKFTGAGGLLKDGPVAVTLSGDNTYAGGTRIVAGTLQVGNGGTAGSIVGNVVNDGTLSFNRSNAMTFAGDVSGNGGLTHAGTGTTTLSGALTYAGPTAVNAGSLALTGANALTGAYSVAANASLSIDTSQGDQSIGAVVSGAGTFTKTGKGSLTLTGNNNPFTGTFNVNGGTAILTDSPGTGGDLGAADIFVNDTGTFQFGEPGGTSGNPDLPDTTYITVNPGGTLVWHIAENFAGVNLQGGTVTLAGGNINAVSASQSWTSGTLNGSANAVANNAVVTKTTSGKVTIAGGATISSVLDIQEGTVAFSSAANLGSAAVRLGTGGAGGTVGTFEYQGAENGSRAGAFALNGQGNVRVVSASAALTLSGVMSGTGSLTKDGPGTLALTGNNSFTGGTTITEGALLANGQTGTNSATGTGPVTVADGGILGGTGSIAGPVTVAGTISPGANAGRLTVGNATLAGGGSYRFELSDAAGAAGLAAGWDVLQGRAGSTLGFTATPAVPFVIDVVSLNAAQSPGAAANFDPSQSYTFQIASFPGGVSGFDPSAVQVNAAAFANLTNGGTFTVVATTTDLNVVYSPVPEPGSLALLGVAAAGLLKRRRRGIV